MKKYASLLIVAAGACWGCLGIFVRNLNVFGIESIEIVEVRSIVCTLVFGTVILVKDRKLFHINPRHLWCFLGTGIVGITFFNMCYFLTIKTASLSVAAVLLYTAPIFVMIFSAALFREPVTKRKAVSLVMAFSGCMLVSGIFDSSAVLSLKGLIIGLCAGIGYACYTVFLRYAVNYGYHPLTTQFYTFVVAAAGGAFLADFGKVAAGVSLGGIKPVLLFAGIGILTTALPNILYNTGMKYVDNGKASVLASAEPVMAILIGIILYREIPTPLSAFGMVLSVAAIILINREESPSKSS